MSIICRFRFQRRKISRQSACRLRTNIRCSTPHILSGKRVISRVGLETQKLIFEVLGSLSGQSWRSREPWLDGPWHQAQFLFASFCPMPPASVSHANEGNEEETIARVTSIGLSSFIIWADRTFSNLGG